MQEPTNQYFTKKPQIITDFIDRNDFQLIQKRIENKFPEHKDRIDELMEDTLKHFKPFIMLTEGQYQAVTDEIFTINGISFHNKAINGILKRSDYVFPHIISTGIDIEKYALEHTNHLHRTIIKDISREGNAIGQSILDSILINDYGVRQILPVFPGEPGWKDQSGIRIVDVFGSLPEQYGLTVTKRGMPNINYTSFGLLIAN